MSKELQENLIIISKIFKFVLIILIIFIIYNLLLFLKNIVNIVVLTFFFSIAVKYISDYIEKLKNYRNLFSKILSLFSRDFIILLIIIFFLLVLISILLIIIPSINIHIKETKENIIFTINTFKLLAEKYFYIIIEKLNIQNLNIEDVYKTFLNELNNNIPNIANFIVNIVLNSTSIIGKAILISVLTFYFTRDYNKIKDFYINILSKKKENKEEIKKLLEKIEDTIGKFILGQLFAALYIFIVIFFILYFLKAKNFFLIALIAGLFELIPFIGAFIGFFLSIIFVLPLGIHKVIIFLILITFFYQLLAKVIYPNVIGKILNISVITVLLSLLIGYKIFGIMGMFISIPVASIIKELICKNYSNNL
jgi:predicted PurR-regulated permease PerM